MDSLLKQSGLAWLLAGLEESRQSNDSIQLLEQPGYDVDSCRELISTVFVPFLAKLGDVVSEKVRTVQSKNSERAVKRECASMFICAYERVAEEISREGPVFEMMPSVSDVRSAVARWGCLDLKKEPSK